MKLTPLDVQQHEFKRRLVGLDAREVRDFLDLVRQTLEAQSRELVALREDHLRQAAELARLREREQVLRDTLVTAQKLADDLKLQAAKDAQGVIAEAETRADKILHKAHARVVRLFDDIRELKRQKIQFEEALRRVLECHLRLLETERENDKEFLAIEANIRVLDPRQATPPPMPEAATTLPRRA